MLHLHRVLAAAVGGTLLLGGVQAVATSLPPDTPTPAVTPGGGDGAERGTDGYRAAPARRVELTRTARTLRVRAVRPGRARVHVPPSEALTGLPTGSPVDGSAWFRARRGDHVAAVVVREHVGDRLVQRQVERVRLSRGEWTEVRTPLTTDEAGSTLTVVVAADATRGTVDVRIRDVDLGVTGPATPPEEPTEPSEPAEPSEPSTPAEPDEPEVGTQPSGAGVLTNGCTYTNRGIPACGASLGATYGGNSDPSVLEGQLGRRLGVRRTFYTGSGVSSAVRNATADLAAGRLPWISFKLPHSWEQMAAGAGDAWAKDLATRLSRLDGPVWVAFHHEPEGDGDIDAWRRMQERLAPLVRSAAPNVAYTVVLTGWNQFFGKAEYSLANLWPRDTKVDVAGFDLYNEYGVRKNGSTITRWPDFDTEYFAKIQRWADARGIAWGMAEWAYTDEGHRYDKDWIEKTYHQMVARGGVAAAYFDTELNAYGSWLLGTDSKRADLAAGLRGSAALPPP